MNKTIFRQDVNYVLSLSLSLVQKIELAFHSSLSSSSYIHFDHPGRGRRRCWKRDLITDADEIIWN